MAFGSSPAENLFDAWHTKTVAKKVTSYPASASAQG